MQKFQPDFENNMLRVLNKGKPERPVLFEFAIDRGVLTSILGHGPDSDSVIDGFCHDIEGALVMGYDSISVLHTPFGFRPPDKELETRCLNANKYISDWESFEKFQWPDMRNLDYSYLDEIKSHLPEGMKLMVGGPSGVLENAIGLVGYDNLCYMLFEEPELVKEIVDNIGSRLLEYFSTVAQHDAVGFVCSNDDWGFNTQTMLSPADLREYIFPWHKKIAEAVHAQGKPCMVHSCGYYNDIIDDVINDIRFDARHSYEDNIVPVEQAYEDLSDRITVLGGIDVHFLCTRTPEEIYVRSRTMLERSAQRGRYALGSGNSIARYVPAENYLAMVRAAQDIRRNQA